MLKLDIVISRYLSKLPQKSPIPKQNITISQSFIVLDK